MSKLFKYQEEALDRTEGLNKVAFYHDCGLGKTFTGASKMASLNTSVNLVVCQKSKIDDWIDHFTENYEIGVYDLTKDKVLKNFMLQASEGQGRIVGVINYDLMFRRNELSSLEDFTLMLDESSLIQNEDAKRTKFIMKKLKFSNLILLSGTPCSGKYENLWSQLHLLGWQISKELFWNTYVDFHYDMKQGFPLRIIDGYKNVERLKDKMREYGCDFLKSDAVLDLPEQIDTVVRVLPTKEYGIFRKDRVVSVNGKQLLGETTLTKMLFERMLCGQYCKEKLDAFEDLLDSTEDRLIVFYNFNDELYQLEDACIKHDRPTSIVNGREKDLTCYEEFGNSVTLIQYQAGSMGLNLQKANKIVYFAPPLSSELFEQSRKRIHRIGQNQTCFYWRLTCKGSIEEKIYKTLAMRKDFTEALFEQEEGE